MSGQVGIALVGLGDIGLSAHLPALERNADVRIVALVDTDHDRTMLAKQRTDVPVARDIAEILTDDDVRGVVLATPPWVTPRLLAEVVATGRFVLAEKPVATSVREAARLTLLPEEARRRVQVGLTYRHDPALELLREWIAGKRLGEPLLIRAHVYDEQRDAMAPEHAARIESTLAHGMPVVHEGAHVFDWLSYLLGGPPERVEDAWALRTRPELTSPNLCGARLGYGERATVLAEFGWLTDALPRCEISVLGDRGHVLLDGHSFHMRLSTMYGEEEVGFEPDRTTRCFDRQLRRFVELITGEWPMPSPDLNDGLAALELSERIAWLARGSMG